MDQVGIYLGEAAIFLLVGYVLKITKDVQCEVLKINGRVRTLEEWRQGNTKLSDERETQTQARFDKLEE